MANLRPIAFAVALFMVLTHCAPNLLSSLQFLFALLSAGADPKQKFKDVFTEGWPPDYSSLCATCALLLVRQGCVTTLTQHNVQLTVGLADALIGAA